jgi:hypothetical protein
LGNFENIKEPAVSMKELAKNQQLEKLFFFNFKKLENQGSTPKPDFRSFFTPVCIYPGLNQYVSVADSNTHVTLVHTGVFGSSFWVDSPDY